MTPAKEVGGDLYGYVLIGDRLYFAVGDVSGKGVPASLFMAQATRLFRTMATQGLMPAEICTRMNNELSGDDNVNGMFVTMFLGMLDMASGHLLEILRNTHFESARQVVETLYAKVQAHRNGAEPNDDLTMMCLRVSLNFSMIE